MVTIERPHLSTSGRLLSAALLIAMLTLSACSFPTPVAQSTPSAASSSEAPAADVGASANPDASASPNTSTSPDAPTGTGGVYGEFGSLSEACLSVSATMLSVTILPLAAMAGGTPEDIEKAKQELSQMEGKVPEELKPAFEKLRAFTEAAGSDFSKYGDGQFEELMKPIQDWTEKNCK
ncbi:hypothetical protein [Paenarthrobacter nitroguajacolicus]|uniref:hypothetical protein n=1 Tax=Paenarthrobacter nitroguajacolicus TaxID=211146 RepID=UPI0015BCFCB3|nr:hypothetical protein [Paenarthrobacter nitroguajacolicus]NWL31371.1 hypothetical protein [Paenarthrobacter nitroguajacolicus]